MRLHKRKREGHVNQLVTAAEVAELLAISSRTVLLSPIRQIRLGPKTIRFRLRDVFQHYGLDEPEEAPGE